MAASAKRISTERAKNKIAAMQEVRTQASSIGAKQQMTGKSQVKVCYGISSSLLFHCRCLSLEPGFTAVLGSSMHEVLLFRTNIVRSTLRRNPWAPADTQSLTSAPQSSSLRHTKNQYEYSTDQSVIVATKQETHQATDCMPCLGCLSNLVSCSCCISTESMLMHKLA